MTPESRRDEMAGIEEAAFLILSGNTIAILMVKFGGPYF